MALFGALSTVNLDLTHAFTSLLSLFGLFHVY